nr:hypothetical protein [Acidobacteriota bacterium]
MKALALYQFYLPYVLPRAPDWTTPIAINFPNFRVLIKPRAVDAELFPNEIDKTLSELTISLPRASLPTGGMTVGVRDRCIDRIEVQVEREIASPEFAKKEKVHDAFWGTAVHACNIFLNHCRVVARVPLITLIRRE